VYILRNQGTNDKPDYAAPNKLGIDVYGMPSPNFTDFDHDGDLDLLCGEFMDGFTYFQNTGSRTEPVYADGHRLNVHMDLQMITPTTVDWDNDGDTDIICGDEDGRVAFIENTGAFTNGIPQFASPVYFKQEAENVKFGALVTPVGVDWDNDGDDDIIAGNTAGYIGFIENLGGKKWATPVRLKADGKTLRILAGPKGSIQGPCEAKWGYTTLSVADWDHDGHRDIIANSIWGKIVWYRNRGNGQLDAAQPVAFNGTAPKPAWNWWSPAPGEMVSQWRTTPVVVDWNKDGRNDLVMLDHQGFLALFARNADGALEPGQRIFHDSKGPLNLTNGPAGKSGRRKLCVVDWDDDGDLDFLINSTNVSLLRNTGTRQGNTMLRDEGLLSKRVLAGHTTSPTMIDLNGDGVQEVLVGAEDGFLYHMPKPIRVQATRQHGSLTITGSDFEIAALENNTRAYANRHYTWQNIPEAYADWCYTRVPGGENMASLWVSSPTETWIYLADHPRSAVITSGDWEPVPDFTFNYTDNGSTQMQVVRRRLAANEERAIPQDSWAGSLLLLPPVKETKPAAPKEAATKEHPNVLFIAVDDLRAELGCYGNFFLGRTSQLSGLSAGAAG
jgi:hypothetical protein